MATSSLLDLDLANLLRKAEALPGHTLSLSAYEYARCDVITEPCGVDRNSYILPVSTSEATEAVTQDSRRFCGHALPYDAMPEGRKKTLNVDTRS
jgi:hypothetical protein